MGGLTAGAKFAEGIDMVGGFSFLATCAVMVFMLAAGRPQVGIRETSNGVIMDKSTWDRLKWGLIKKHLGYSKDELDLFKSNPRNEAVLDKGRDLQAKRITIAVVESSGCNSRHRVGDKFVFDGAGNLLTRESPERICVFALNAATGLIFAASELFYAGVDPNEMRFRRSGCFDVGVQCGGWGKVVVEISVADQS